MSFTQKSTCRLCFRTEETRLCTMKGLNKKIVQVCLSCHNMYAGYMFTNEQPVLHINYMQTPKIGYKVNTKHASDTGNISCNATAGEKKAADEKKEADEKKKVDEKKETDKKNADQKQATYKKKAKAAVEEENGYRICNRCPYSKVRLSKIDTSSLTWTCKSCRRLSLSVYIYKCDECYFYDTTPNCNFCRVAATNVYSGCCGLPGCNCIGPPSSGEKRQVELRKLFEKQPQTAD
jgi:hypothetical protein